VRAAAAAAVPPPLLLPVIITPFLSSLSSSSSSSWPWSSSSSVCLSVCVAVAAGHGVFRQRRELMDEWELMVSEAQKTVKTLRTELEAVCIAMGRRY
jgi:hypothetical protein